MNLQIRPSSVRNTPVSRLNIREMCDSRNTSEGDTWYAIHPITWELVEIDPEQLWFWTPKWQAGECKVEKDLQLGRYEDFDSMDDFIANL
jgi:hypothetical protein